MLIIQVILILGIFRTSSTQECRSWKPSLSKYSKFVKGYMSSQFNRGVDDVYPVENIFDGNQTTFIQTKCYKKASNACIGTITTSPSDNNSVTSASFLDNLYAWIIIDINIQIVQIIKSVTVTGKSYYIDLVRDMDILVASNMTPHIDKTYGFRGLNWNDFTLCGNTGQTTSSVTTVTCSEAQQFRYIALRTHLKTVEDLKSRYSIYISEVNVAFYNITQPSVSNFGIWSENSGGETVSVCTPGLSNKYKFKWYQEYFVGNKSYVGETHTNAWSFPSVSRYNAGRYYVKCLSKTSNNIIFISSKTTTVRVTYKAKIIDLYLTSFSFYENATFLAKCSSTAGYPHPKVYPKLELSIENIKIPKYNFKVSNYSMSKYYDFTNSITLTKHASREMNRKHVICKLMQGNTQLHFKKKQIEVYYNSSITQFDVNKTQLSEGESIILKCSSSASYPHPVVKIFIENTALNVFETKNESDEFGGESQTVSVSSVVTREWNGKYVYCKLMQNNLITESSRYFITVHYKSDILAVNSSSSSPTEFSNVTLFCHLESRGFPPADIIWKLNEQVLSDVTNMTQFTIKSITLSQSGNYSCITRNYAGESVQTVQIVVRISPVTISTRKSDSYDGLSTTNKPQTTTNELIIILPIVGVFLFVAAIVVLVFLVWRYRNSETNVEQREMDIYDEVPDLETGEVCRVRSSQEGQGASADAVEYVDIQHVQLNDEQVTREVNNADDRVEYGEIVGSDNVTLET